MRGGVFTCPRDRGDTARGGRPLHEVSPIAMIVEQAGVRAASGHARILEVAAEELHQHAPLMCGSGGEVQPIDSHHRQLDGAEIDAPLFGARGLIRRKFEA